jgi:hypothetical protein
MAKAGDELPCHGPQNDEELVEAIWVRLDRHSISRWAACEQAALSAYLSEAGRLDWLITSKIALNRTRMWYEDFSYCAEAQQLQLPVYQIEDSKPVELST